jgi:hypothetical protein
MAGCNTDRGLETSKEIASIEVAGPRLAVASIDFDFRIRRMSTVDSSSLEDSSLDLMLCSTTSTDRGWLMILLCDGRIELIVAPRDREWSLEEPVAVESLLLD